MEENTQEENSGSESKNQKPWLETQLEKLVGKQENMQPLIRTLFSLVGFTAGFIVGRWVLGKEKDRQIESLTNRVIEFRNKNAEQEKELRSAIKQMEESKEKQMRQETELKFIKEHSEYSKEGNGLIPNRRTERSFLD